MRRTSTYRPPPGTEPIPRQMTSTSAFVAGKTICVQHFSGEIDVRSEADVAVALNRVASMLPDGVILDMSEVEFLAVTGLSLMTRFAGVLADRAVPLVVVGTTTVSRPIAVCGLTAQLPTFPTFVAARISLSNTLLCA